MKWCREPRCSPRVRLVCRGTFEGCRKAIRDRFALQGGTGDFPSDAVAGKGVCGTRGPLRTMHGGGSAPSCCAFTHRVAFAGAQCSCDG